MPLLPHRFLFRMAHACRYQRGIPLEEGDDLLDLPESCRVRFLGAMDGQKDYADLRLAWNELGVGVQVRVKGKEEPPRGDASRPRGSDGLTLWIDTRQARASHRASQFCHQFHFLPTGGGPEKNEPCVVQAAIHRALQDAPLHESSEIPLRCEVGKGGWLLEAFLGAGVLNGFDPEQNPRLGFCCVVHDHELGDQVLSVGPEFPYWEDPSLWSILDLVRAP